LHDHSHVVFPRKNDGLRIAARPADR
jgi:hypothetical protein